MCVKYYTRYACMSRYKYKYIFITLKGGKGKVAIKLYFEWILDLSTSEQFVNIAYKYG